MSAEDISVLICEYDPNWPSYFAALAARVQASLGDLVSGVEHIGSTAVPDLAAKPIVDLDVVVSSTDLRETLRRLASLGYAHEGNLGILGREAFRWPSGERRHHLYVVVEGSAELRRHVAFRDALRADLSLRLQYANLKRSLADRYKSDPTAYTDAKSAFIAAAMKCRNLEVSFEPEQRVETPTDPSANSES